MPWSHLSHALVAGTGQSTAHSCLLWMFIFENYADPSLDRHRRLIGMRPGTRFFVYGMNGLEVLLQMPTSTQKLLEFGKTCCQFAWASVGSTFALLASFWHSTCGPSTKHLGFKTWCVLPICESWILERCGIGQHPMELTSCFVCKFLPHVNSSCVHIFTFCACALKRARLWHTGLTWPDWRTRFQICMSCWVFSAWIIFNVWNRIAHEGHVPELMMLRLCWKAFPRNLLEWNVLNWFGCRINQSSNQLMPAQQRLRRSLPLEKPLSTISASWVSKQSVHYQTTHCNVQISRSQVNISLTITWQPDFETSSAFATHGILRTTAG